MNDCRIHRFRWLLHPTEAPRAFVRVTVQDRIIQEVADVPADERHLAHGTLIPPLVNAHTHLEFSSLPAPIEPPLPFTHWIRNLVAWRRSQADSGRLDAVSRGVRELRQTGCRFVGEICTSTETHRHLIDAAINDIRIVSFREVLGFTRDRVTEQTQVLEDHIANSSTDVSVGVSPHAPYSTHPELVSAAARIARENCLPLAMHLAETKEERQLLESQTGPFRDLLEELALWDDSVLRPGGSPLDYLQILAQVPRALAVHCNYLSHQEIQFLSDNQNIAAVYCPRTHRWFQHSAHPIRKLLTAGATVVLGTDGRGSNPDLSIWDELTVAAEVLKSPIWELLPMVTTTAARAIGLQYCSIAEPGDSICGYVAATSAESLSDLNRELGLLNGQQLNSL